jgi:predicted metallo-beta-lactamase superfamily hydrolase
MLGLEWRLAGSRILSKSVSTGENSSQMRRAMPTRRVTQADDVGANDHDGRVFAFGSLLVAHDVDQAHQSHVGGVIIVVRQEGDGQEGGLRVHVAQHVRSNSSA